MAKYEIGDMLLAFPYDEMLGYYRGDDYGNPIQVEVVSIRKINIELYLYGVLDQHGYIDIYQEIELFRTQKEIDKLT